MKQAVSQRPSRWIRQRQSGAVLVMLGVTLVVLLGFAALAIDLGRTYLVRTELQNAADAAALAGAKELNQTANGVNNAVEAATNMAAQHTFNFGKAVISANADLLISFGKCPEEKSACDWRGQADAAADPVERSFIKVEIQSRSFPTFFGGVLGAPNAETFGLAVAGYSLVNLTPIGICAIDPNVARTTTAAGEVVEYGFRRGIGYNVLDLTPLAPGDHYLINPVDKYVVGDVHAECNPENGSPGRVAPFLCTGASAAVPIIPSASGSWVWGDTGMETTLNDALNSRFYPPKSSGVSACSAASAPLDTNIMQYVAPTGVDWMSPPPAEQSITYVKDKKTDLPVQTSYGVLWSYSRAMKADGTYFASTDWATLYPAAGSAPSPVANAAFPTTSTPYWDTGSSKHFTPGNNGVAERRVLNLAIIDCPSSGVKKKTGECVDLKVLAIGKFFMQRAANLPKSLDAEFAGAVTPASVQIKLYR